MPSESLPDLPDGPASPRADDFDARWERAVGGRSGRRRRWLLPLGLVVLTAVAVAVGIGRLTDRAGRELRLTVTAATGPVEARRAGQSRPARVGDVLAGTEELLVSAGASAEVRDPYGGSVQLAGPAELRLTEAPLDTPPTVVLVTGRLARTGGGRPDRPVAVRTEVADVVASDGTYALEHRHGLTRLIVAGGPVAVVDRAGWDRPAERPGWDATPGSPSTDRAAPGPLTLATGDAFAADRFGAVVDPAPRGDVGDVKARGERPSTQGDDFAARWARRPLPPIAFERRVRFLERGRLRRSASATEQTGLESAEGPAGVAVWIPAEFVDDPASTVGGWGPIAPTQRSDRRIAVGFLLADDAYDAGPTDDRWLPAVGTTATLSLSPWSRHPERFDGPAWAERHLFEHPRWWSGKTLKSPVETANDLAPEGS